MLNRLISKDEYKVLKLFDRSNRVPAEAISNEVGQDKFSGIAHTLQDVIGLSLEYSLDFPVITDQSTYDPPYKSKPMEYVVVNEAERTRLMWEFRKDRKRKWIPVVIADTLSVLAIVVSIVALIVAGS